MSLLDILLPDRAHLGLDEAKKNLVDCLVVAVQAGLRVGPEGSLSDLHSNQHGRPLPVLQEHMGLGTPGQAPPLLAVAQILAAQKTVTASQCNQAVIKATV